MKYLPLVLSFTLIVILPDAVASAAIYASEEKILEGELFAREPLFDSVGFMSTPNPNGDGNLLWGSGVLIHPQWMLTAGHVVFNGGTTFHENASVGFTNDLFNEEIVRYPVEQMFAFPGYSENQAPGAGQDIGLIKLVSPINGVPTAERFRGQDEIGRRVLTSGYGRPGVYPQDSFNINGGRGREFDGVKRAGEDIVESFDTFPRLPDFMNINFNQFSGQLPLEWSGSAFDSGGGWFSEIDGRYQLVGIGAFGAGLAETSAIRVSLYNDWIDATIAANTVPEPAAISMLLAGLIGSLAIRRRAA